MVFHKYKLIVVGIPKNASQSLYYILANKSDYENDHENDEMTKITMIL